HGVFQLKHRARRGESHFDPALREPADTPFANTEPEAGAAWPAAAPVSQERERGVIDRLARVARSPSSLPAAFEPSLAEATLMNGVLELPPGRSFNYVLDGGFLNNRPLDLAIKAVSERRADLEVQRKLFFVEPTPDEFAPQGELRAPTALENLWFFKDVPGRQSLAGYLDAVYEHNRCARRVKETLTAAREMTRGAMPRPEDEVLKDPAARLWVELRVQDLRDEIIASWQQQLGLEGFSESLSVEAPQASYRRQLAEAERLRAARSCLLEALEAGRDTWLRRAVAYVRRDTGGFRLAEFDCVYLARKIGR